MIGVRNIEEVQEIYSPFLVMAAREWIFINRKDLDPYGNIDDLLRTEVTLFTKFDPYDVDNETGEYSLKLTSYAFCNKSYADLHKLTLTGPEGGNMGNEVKFLKFKKYKDPQSRKSRNDK